MKKINEFKTTGSMAMDALAKSMTGKVYNLSAGDPNIDLCDALKETYLKADLSKTHNYGGAQGSIDLRKRLWKRPEEVIIANGAKQLVYESLAAVSEPGDKVLIIGPCWPSYMRICEILRLDYVLLVGDEADGYVPSIEKVAQTLTNEFAAIVINNPNNPTGMIYSEDYLEKLHSIAIENDLWLIADEIYMFIADSDQIVMTLRGMDNVITIDGFSKSLNITGWRLGYAIADKEVIKAMSLLQSQLSGAPSTLIQSIVNEAWPAIELTDFEAYRERIDLLCQIDKFKAHRPKGTFYFYLPIDDKWESSTALCEYMIKNHNIVMVAGDDYGVERTVRISLAFIHTDDLKEIVDKLREI